MELARTCAVVIPCLNEAAAIAPLVTEARRLIPAVIVVDDGSADGTGRRAAAAGAQVLMLPKTSGKGAALSAGCRKAHADGFAWAILMDGDGQHAPADLPVLLATAENRDASLVIGNRMANPAAAMPWSRRVTNRLMSLVLSKLTGRNLPDTQCGFRLVRLERWMKLELRCSHFEIESEMLVAFLVSGCAVEFVPMRAIYLPGRSKIHPVRDAVRWLRWLWSARQDFARIRKLPQP